MALDGVLVVIQARPYWDGGEKIVAVYPDNPEGKKGAEAAADLAKRLGDDLTEVRIEAHSLETTE